MTEYPKIESVFKRHEHTHKLIDGAWRLPEFEYLKDCLWIWTEKVDGTNIRVMWDGKAVRFGGRTDNAQIYVPLLDCLIAMFTPDALAATFPAVSGESDGVCLYGEGYGARIQKGGGNYSKEVDFALFDVRVGRWWLTRGDAEDVASVLALRVVPIMGRGGLEEAVQFTKDGFESTWGPFQAEGLVCRPAVDLIARNGQRIITKMKRKDW